MDLITAVTALRSSLRLIFVITIGTAILALGVSQLLPKDYTTDSRVLVGSITDPTTDKLTAYQQLAQTYAELATTTPVLARVSQRLGGTADPVELGRRVDARAGLGETIITVTAHGGTSTQSADLANAVADEIAAMSTGSDSSTSLARVVQPATPPDGPSSPKPFLNLAIATALALLASCGFVLLRASQALAARPARDREQVVALLEERLARRAQ